MNDSLQHHGMSKRGFFFLFEGNFGRNVGKIFSNSGSFCELFYSCTIAMIFYYIFSLGWRIENINLLIDCIQCRQLHLCPISGLHSPEGEAMILHLKTPKCSRLDCNGRQGLGHRENGWKVKNVGGGDLLFSFVSIRYSRFLSK